MTERTIDLDQHRGMAAQKATDLRSAASGQFAAGALLGAFDLNRQLIYATAAKVYGRGHKGSYDLLPDDF
jgi:hypothetical protein